VEIFETKSKYYKNPNAKFAGVFSNLAVTITALFIGIVLLIWLLVSCIHWHWEAKIVRNVQHQLEYYGFTVKGLKYEYNMDPSTDETQEQLRIELSARNLSNPKLQDGRSIDYPRIVATTRSWGGAEFHVENIALPDQKIDSWVDYIDSLNHPKPVIIPVQPDTLITLDSADLAKAGEQAYWDYIHHLDSLVVETKSSTR
jgi:hypothetical protein